MEIIFTSYPGARRPAIWLELPPEPGAAAAACQHRGGSRSVHKLS